MHIGCKTRLLALHDHNEEKVVGNIIRMLLEGESVALVSDAGTPLVSDPGFRLVREAHANAIAVSPIPGASAVTAAVSVAGIPTDRFCFEGFLPSKQLARRDTLARLATEQRTMIFYESVHRIDESVADMAVAFGAERQAFLGRELSKMHEQCVQGSLGSIAAMLLDSTIRKKGEFVLVIAGAAVQETSAEDVDRLLSLLAEKLPTKEAAGIVAEFTGHRKNDLYERLLELRNE
jgi:16S rRNA (cytidine1402-2'-O)-methyltransferase